MYLSNKTRPTRKKPWNRIEPALNNSAYDEPDMTQNDPTRGARRGAMSRAVTNQKARPVLPVAPLTIP